MNQPKNASPIFKDKKSRMILIALISALLFMIIFSFWQSEKFDQEIALKSQFIEEKGLKKLIQTIEIEAVKESMKRNQGVITKCIKELKISSSAFYRILDKVKLA